MVLSIAAAAGYTLLILSYSPTTSCGLAYPSLTSFAAGVLYLVLSQAIVAVFGLAALSAHGRGALLVPMGMLLCASPFFLEPYV